MERKKAMMTMTMDKRNEHSNNANGKDVDLNYLNDYDYVFMILPYVNYSCIIFSWLLGLFKVTNALV